jgi:hypothetical protein
MNPCRAMLEFIVLVLMVGSIALVFSHSRVHYGNIDTCVKVTSG